jgi:hypothetical protein
MSKQRNSKAFAIQGEKNRSGRRRRRITDLPATTGPPQRIRK